MTLCEEALTLINCDRRKDYGDYSEEAQRVAAMWSVITGYNIKPRHISLMMIALKLSRESYAHKHDNLVDIIGYTLLHEKLCQPK